MNNITNYNDCVKYALVANGIEGDSFKDTNMRVYERCVINPGTFFTTLKKGCIMVPIINTAIIGKYDVDISATVVMSANQDDGIVNLYIPMTKTIEPIPINVFLEAWKATGGLCSTAFKPDASTYRPKLINLKYVDLPDGFEELREAIAENVHDRWALERQSEGWTYGPKRDDEKLETPDMVPYSELPDSEKQYDRVMAEDTLKLLTVLGYKIEKM